MSFFPHDGKIASDGKRILVFWERENITSGSNMEYTIFYSTPWLRDITSNISITAVTVLILLIMITIVLYIRKPKKKEMQPMENVEKKGEEEVKPEREKEIPEISVSALNRDEEVLVNIIKNEGGKAYQKVLVRNSGFSKAKVSRILKSLKERNVVEIEPVSGRENMVKLKIPEKEKQEENEKTESNIEMQKE